MLLVFALVAAAFWIGIQTGKAEVRDELERLKVSDWPIAKLTVHEDSEQVSVMLYAPGLPVGEFDVWLGPHGDPTRTPLTIEQINALSPGTWPMSVAPRVIRLLRDVERAHGIGEVK